MQMNKLKDIENKRNRLLKNLQIEKEIQMNKIKEDGEIQEKRIINYINFERDNMIEAFKEEKEIKKS